MRSIQSRSLPCRAAVAALVACLLGVMLFARVNAAPQASGVAGGTWHTIDQPPLAGQRVTALLPDGADGMWVGTEERGLAHWDGKSWRTLTSSDGLPDDRVVALFVDRREHLWISTGTGLGYLPSGAEDFRRVPTKGLPSLPVTAIGEASDGGILLGVPSGMALWHPDGAFALAPELAGKRVLAIHTARDGVTWIGTPVGLWRSAGLGWQRDEQLAGAVSAFAEGPDGRLFLAGEKGASELTAGHWKLIRPSARGQFTTAALHAGTLWLGGLGGLTAGQGEIWHTYDPRFLASPAVTALAWTSDGGLWAGSTSGLTIHQPDSSAPRVTIESINGLALPAGPVILDVDHIDHIVLAAEDLASPGGSATPPDELRYFLRLDGIDDAPRLLATTEAADPRGISVYAARRLPAGTHVLRAWAEDDAFKRSAEAQVSVVVPALVHLPGGLAVPNEAAYASMASVALLLTAGATTGLARRTRRRQLTRAAEAATARVRRAVDRSDELYASPVALRRAEVLEAVGALPTQGVLLLGDEGMGKSETLRGIADALAHRIGGSERLLAAPVDLASARADALFPTLIAAATAALYPLAIGARPRLNWNEGAPAPYGEADFSADLGVLFAWLQPQRTERLVLVYLIDDADLIDGYSGAARDAFRRLIIASSQGTSPVRLVLASERAPGVVQGSLNVFHTVMLGAVAGAAGVQLLRQGAAGIVEWDKEAERLVLERAGGVPARLIGLGRAAALAALADGRLFVSAADVTASSAPVAARTP